MQVLPVQPSQPHRVEELHRPANRVKHFRKVLVRGLNDTFSADLVDMTQFADENGGFKWMLTVIDVFSRYAWAIPAKSKSAESILDAFKQVIVNPSSASARVPRKFWVDQGSEFVNAQMKKYLKSLGTTMYHSFGQHGAMVIERFNRTLKTRMFKEFAKQNNYRWVDILPELMHAYNTSKHGTIKMTPTEASNPINEQRLLDLQSQKPVGKAKPPTRAPRGRKSPHVGSFVRMSRQKGAFEKGYTRKWSEEIFSVVAVIHTDPKVYELEDLRHEPVIGAFYEPEIAVTETLPTDKMFIQHILEKKGGKSLVQWMGYNVKFDSWVPTNSIEMFDRTVVVGRKRVTLPNKHRLPHPIGQAQMFSSWGPKTTMKTLTL